ncbi:DUF397 domain-containing protein [Kitasatospora sp. NPDC056783]|uniref:DUF397 domain-containing protein n=1 Tax=Kitasatospora sp. NPDC056783 TaxID=3345943 RepID=UPI0036B1FA0A
MGDEHRAQDCLLLADHHSGGGGNCGEVAATGHVYYIRDSKDPYGPALAVTPQAYTELLHAIAADIVGRPEEADVRHRARGWSRGRVSRDSGIWLCRVR